MLPTMGVYFPWIFIDQLGQVWALGMNSSGQLTFTQSTAVNGSAAYPLKDIATGETYQVSVVTTGGIPALVATLSSGPTVGSFIPVTRATANTTYYIQVSSGTLVANLEPGVITPDPVLGQIYSPDMVNPPVNPPNLPDAGLLSPEPGGWLPPYTQPAGLNTQTFPAQQDGTGGSPDPSNVGLLAWNTGVPYEIGMGLNTAGCGHWFNCFDTTFSTVDGQQSALIRCPLCGYLQMIITPAALLYTAAYEHISS